MKKIILYLLMPAYIFTSTSCMTSKTDSVRVAMEKNKATVAKEKRGDAQFAVCAADAGMLEGKLAELVKAKATSPAVKSLGKVMAKEHAEEHNELKAIAAKEDIVLPTKLSDRSQKAYDYLAKKDGKAFDKAFLKCAKKGSKMELWKVKHEAKKGNDAAIKSWAANNVEMVEKRIALAKDATKQDMVSK